MTSIQWISLLAALLTVCGLAAAALSVLRQRNMQYWIKSYYFPSERAEPVVPDQPIDVFLAICDHWEPQCNGASKAQAMERVRRWVTEYPKAFSGFRDVNGRPPQHTFFFPQEEYQPEYLDQLAQLTAKGFGDVDIHIHHDGDTADQLREKLEKFRDTLFHRHGLLRRDPLTGQIAYGFVHGNWALCNSRPDGRWCGVDQELAILKQTGCYADFTLPSAPTDCQTSMINSIYYAKDVAGQRKSHDTGIRARVGRPPPPDHLLMIQGPLSLDWQARRYGVIPRIENSDLTAGRPPTARRLKQWMDVGVHVAGRPNWKFVKLHTHGCEDRNVDMCMGPEMQAFHTDLARQQRDNSRLRLHYVTAWEMALLVRQAEAGAMTPNVAVPPLARLTPQTGSRQRRPPRVIF
jgi:hypothetical protein